MEKQVVLAVRQFLEKAGYEVVKVEYGDRFNILYLLGENELIIPDDIYRIGEICNRRFLIGVKDGFLVIVIY